MGKSKRKRQAPPPRRPDAPPRPAPRSTRRKQSPWVAYWPVIAVATLIVAALVGIYLYARSTSAPAGPAASDTTASVIGSITRLDLTQGTAVGAGGVANPFKRTRSSQPLAGPSGHPAVLYIGAEYCPYCAAERWSLVVALSRFGTFTGLQLTQSSSTDIYPNTPTLTFAKASFQSPTVELQAVETEDRNQRPLQQPTAAQKQLMAAYDAAGSIPFVDVGNKQYEVGSGFLPDNLQGKTWEQVALAIQDPSSPLGQQVLGNANWITAAICQSAGDAAAPACSNAQIKALEAQLGT